MASEDNRAHQVASTLNAEADRSSRDVRPLRVADSVHADESDQTSDSAVTVMFDVDPTGRDTPTTVTFKHRDGEARAAVFVALARERLKRERVELHLAAVLDLLAERHAKKRRAVGVLPDPPTEAPKVTDVVRLKARKALRKSGWSVKP